MTDHTIKPEIHAQHPARDTRTLCGIEAGDGCRRTRAGPVTCDACRAVVGACRDLIRLDRKPDEDPPESAKLTLRCPDCGLSKITQRIKGDPVQAEVIEMLCHDCDSGGFDNPNYFDAAGIELQPSQGLTRGKFPQPGEDFCDCKGIVGELRSV